MQKLLEELKKVDGNSTEFQRGFNTAINIIIALNKSEESSVKDLEREVAKLQLRIAALEVNKQSQPYRWTPYVTYCDTSTDNIVTLK